MTDEMNHIEVHHINGYLQCESLEADSIIMNKEVEKSNISCESCKNMDWDYMYCLFIKRDIQNGWAMKAYSSTCGGFHEKERD